MPCAGMASRLDWLRRITAKPYPYVIFYEVTAQDIIIHAVRHAAMSPTSMPDAEDI
jgi:plasmid stabilization system protein ParE